MNILKSLGFFGLAAVLALAAAPLSAENHGGGTHFSSGGMHMAPAHTGNAGGLRAGYAAPARFTAPNGRYGGPHGGVRYSNGFAAGVRPGFVRPGFTRAPGFASTVGGRSGRSWRGGYWAGRYWPGSGIRLGASWFLPVLPLGFATYWWGGLPYYYYDDAYYTWNPSYSGYVATDPPPVSESSQASADGNAQEGSADVFAYPKNGQSDEQAAKDRSECQAWAVAETGFDPTRSSSNPQGSVSNYQRAMGACLDARGYSTR